MDFRKQIARTTEVVQSGRLSSPPKRYRQGLGTSPITTGSTGARETKRRTFAEIPGL